MPAQPDQFGFTKLLVVDLDKCAAFYSEVFGLKETTRIASEIGGRGLDEILFSPTGDGAATFVLLKFHDATAPSANEVILGFLTADVDALTERAIAAGGSVVREPLDYPDLRVKVAFVADIEGHLIEVVQLVA
jgi:predicted enzyme related to lactoylglutathione lyase